jgi:hypothetical protein
MGGKRRDSKMAGAFFFLLVAALLVCLLSLSQGVAADDCDSCVMHEGSCVHAHNPDHSDKHISFLLCGSYGHCDRRKINEVEAEGVALALHAEDVLQD